ncbi:AAA family ATPase, partial [Anaerospora hongkongensis]|uniref:AAA family ATPase n=1 Tax=Anaerospora hongkongensis TaxID=244830 RepID=UPI002FDA977D
MRHNLLEETNELLTSHRFIQIKGLPGTGKSALLKEIVQSKLNNGTVLFLKSDRLIGNSWAAFAKNIGLATQNIEILLSEIAVTGTPTLFIDGIDRIQPTHRKIVLDLVNAIMNSSVLSHWCVMVTSRDVGIEPLRNWLPTKLFSNVGVDTVTVDPLNDEEAEILAAAKPELRTLLFAAGRVKEIARRPFFAYVLARGISAATMQTGFAPQSEINLIEAWWEGGGYHSEPQEIFKRQHALEELAKVSARRFGLRILYSELSISTIEILHNLIDDGIIHETQKGVACKFAHDIFFEWSEFYLLKRKDENWLDALIDAREPPVLGRVVELLSQSFFSSEQEWPAHLMRIETSVLRSQWQRAWLIGPFGMPDFEDSITTFEKAISQDNYRRLRSLFVWFQAEKTVPNKLVLNGQLISTELPSYEIIRIADMLGWPSDFSAWRRLIIWTLDQVECFPCTVIPDIVSVFEVWQNALAGYPNVLSDRIVKKCLDWLIDIEDKLHPEEWSYNLGKWRELGHDNLKNLETSLRMLVLRSARTTSVIVKAYLERAISK